MSEEVMLDAYSKTNEHGVPYLMNCTLIVGDGTQKVDFENGRAKVPESFAHLVARHEQIDIPALDPLNATSTLSAEDIAAVDAARELRRSKQPAGIEAPIKEDKKAVKAAREYLAEEGEDVPEPEPELRDLTKADLQDVAAETGVGISGTKDEIATRIERDAFESHTEDGQPRCQAAKTDGTQCSNSANDGEKACGLGKHKEQLH